MENSKQKKKVTASADLGESKISTGFDWTRADRTSCRKDPGKRYRHVSEANVSMKQAEGWEIVPDQKSAMPKMVLMRLGEQQARARAEYFEGRNKANLGVSGENLKIKRTERTE